MKKILFLFIMTLSFISSVKAFDVDTSKININSYSKKVIGSLNKTYNIDVEDFDNKSVVDEEVYEFALELLKHSFESSSLEEKKKSLTSYMHYSSDNGVDTLNASLFTEMFIKQIEEKNIKIDYIKEVKTVTFNENDAMAFVYLPNSMIENEEKDLIVAFWLKEANGKYGLYFPWMTSADNLESYFNSISDNESKGINIGGTFNQVSTVGNESEVSKEKLNEIFQDNKNSVVQITGLYESGSSVYGSGFFIREGVVVTTWSLFSQILNKSNYVYVNDVEGNTYNVLGVVAAQIDYDVVVLKIDKNVGQGVKFAQSDTLRSNDKLFMINSKNNSGFSINYGSFLSINKGRMKNMFLLNSSDVGAALFNQKGEVVGITVQDQLYSDLSYANSTDYLVKLGNVLNKQSYQNITYTIVETFKQNYYSNLNEEKIYNNVESDVWNEYKKIGNIEENITLPLVKSSYSDDILSLRYKNEINNTLDTMYLVSSYTDTLVDMGYSLTYEDQYKTIYKNEKYKVVIKNNLNYLIVLIMEI